MNVRSAQGLREHRLGENNDEIVSLALIHKTRSRLRTLPSNSTFIDRLGRRLNFLFDTPQDRTAPRESPIKIKRNTQQKA